jgi:hypothetical protein
MKTRSPTAQLVRNGLVAIAAISWIALCGWFWYWFYSVYAKEPPYTHSRVADLNEASAALHASCAASDAGSALVPALRVPPNYPDRALQSRIEGSVELELLILSEGTVL